ncbi:MAG TPA: alpha/beta hydrolase family protein, partial [Archangium sp.]|nr:alpha/beta hydrolase family protein [Archangium sp.]
MNRMHWLDALAAKVTVARQPRFFEDGWGSNALLEKLTRGPQGFAFPELTEVTVRPARREGHLLVQEGRFPSPAAVGSLPEACREARFQLLLPHDAGPRP